MSDTTRLLKLIDEYSASVMRFIYLEDYYENFQKTDSFIKASDQEQRVRIDRAEEHHRPKLRPIKAKIRDLTDQLATEINDAKTECRTDILELSNLIDMWSVGVTVIKTKWARVAAHLTLEIYEHNPDLDVIKSLKVTDDGRTVSDLASDADVTSQTIRRDAKSLQLPKLKRGEKYEPSQWIQIIRERLKTPAGKRNEMLEKLNRIYETVYEANHEAD